VDPVVILARTLLGESASEDTVNEVARIGLGAGSLVIYGVFSMMSKGYSGVMAIILSLAYALRKGFLKMIFNVLITTPNPSDKIIDSAGLVAAAYLLSPDEEGGELLLSLVKISSETFSAISTIVRNIVMRNEEAQGAKLGDLRDRLTIIVTTVIILIVVGTCQGILNGGYPRGIREFLEYSLSQHSQMALSELLSTA